MPKVRSARSSVGRRAAEGVDHSRSRGRPRVARPSVDRRPTVRGDQSRGQSRGRAHVTRDTDGVSRQSLHPASSQDPPVVPAQPGHRDEESVNNDLPVTADRLLAIIRSEVERLVSPNMAATVGGSEHPTSATQQPSLSPAGRVR